MPQFGRLSATFWKVVRPPSASEHDGSASVSIDEVEQDDGVSVFEEDQDTHEGNTPPELMNRVNAAIATIKPI